MDASLRDRTAIVETCTRMAWHADRREWDQLTEIFTDTVRVDYTSLNGGRPTTRAGKDLVEDWRAGLSGFASTQHLVTNHLVDVTGDSAVVTAGFQATHVLPNQQGGPMWTIGGNYRYELSRTGEDWKISAITMTMTWAEGNRQLPELAASREREFPS